METTLYFFKLQSLYLNTLDLLSFNHALLKKVVNSLNRINTKNSFIVRFEELEHNCALLINKFSGFLVGLPEYIFQLLGWNKEEDLFLNYNMKYLSSFNVLEFHDYICKVTNDTLYTFSHRLEGLLQEN